MVTFVPRGAATVVLALLLACGSDPASPAPAPDAFLPNTLVAFPSTFQGFRQWTSFHDDGPPAGTVSVDALGPRMQYLNQIPDHGQSEFPVGTVIVEVRESGGKNIFAGVKRGGGFNAAGANGWEWFELLEAQDGSVSILWRGLGPPAGSSSYGGNGRCNACHVLCDDNDSICSPVLRLAQF